MLDIRNATKRRRWNWLFLQLLINPVTPTQCSSSLPTPQDSPPKIQMRPQHFPATVSCVCFTWKESIHAFALPDPAWTVGTSIILRWTHPSLLQWFQVGQMNYFVNCGLRCLSKSKKPLLRRCYWHLQLLSAIKVGKPYRFLSNSWTWHDRFQTHSPGQDNLRWRYCCWYPSNNCWRCSQVLVPNEGLPKP